MPGLRRFSQAISEGDGISLIVDVHSVDQARTAQTGGAEASESAAYALPPAACSKGPRPFRAAASRSNGR